MAARNVGARAELLEALERQIDGSLREQALYDPSNRRPVRPPVHAQAPLALDRRERRSAWPISAALANKREGRGDLRAVGSLSKQLNVRALQDAVASPSSSWSGPSSRSAAASAEHGTACLSGSPAQRTSVAAPSQGPVERAADGVPASSNAATPQPDAAVPGLQAPTCSVLRQPPALCKPAADPRKLADHQPLVRVTRGDRTCTSAGRCRSTSGRSAALSGVPAFSAAADATQPAAAPPHSMTATTATKQLQPLRPQHWPSSAPASRTALPKTSDELRAPAELKRQRRLDKRFALAEAMMHRALVSSTDNCASISAGCHGAAAHRYGAQHTYTYPSHRAASSSNPRSTGSLATTVAATAAMGSACGPSLSTPQQPLGCLKAPAPTLPPHPVAGAAAQIAASPPRLPAEKSGTVMPTRAGRSAGRRVDLEAIAAAEDCLLDAMLGEQRCRAGSAGHSKAGSKERSARPLWNLQSQDSAGPRAVQLSSNE